ncbi:hypothetical protein Hanom_Chr10g00956561 [Helianthus anomalus]
MARLEILTPNELGGSLMSERVKRIKKERRKRIRMRGKYNLRPFYIICEITNFKY